MPPEETEHDRRNKVLFGDDCLLQHADRSWRAETENAARLSSRISFLFSGLVALFGLGLFKIEWFRRTDDVARIASPTAAFWIKVLLLGSVLLFCAAFAILMWGKRKRQTVHASEKLALPTWYIENPPNSKWTARKLVFICTYEAFLNLQGQNKEKDERIRKAQIPFVAGFALVVLAIIMYTWNVDKPMISSGDCLETGNSNISSQAQPAGGSSERARREDVD